MPNQDDSDDPPRNPDKQSSSFAPPPLPVEQSVMGESSKSDTKQSQAETKELAREIHWVEKATMWSQIGLAVIGIAALVVYHDQLTVMQRQLSEMKEATRASAISAEAAKNASQTANNELVVSQRPWVVVEVAITGVMTFSDKYISGGFNTTLSNIGHSPALNVSTHIILVASAAGKQEFTDARFRNAFSEVQGVCSDAVGDSKAREVGSTLFPGGHSTNFRYYAAEKKATSQYILEVIGCVTYTIPFNKESHQTGFWGIVVIPSSKSPNTYMVYPRATTILPAEKLRIIGYRVFAN